MPKRFFALADDGVCPAPMALDMANDSHGQQVDDAQFRVGHPFT